MKLFNQLFVILIVSLGLIGFVLPYLFSSNTYELTTLGVLIILAVAYTTGRLIVRELTKEDK